VKCNNKIYDWITSCWQVKVRQTSWNQKQGWGDCTVWSLRCSGRLPTSVCSKFPRKFGTAHSSHLHGTCPRNDRTLKMGLQRCPETSVHKLHTDVEQLSERAWPQLHCGKDLYPRMGAVCQVRSHYIVWNLKCNVNKSKPLEFKKKAEIKQNERVFTTKHQERQKV